MILLKELVNICSSSGDKYAEISVFDNEDDLVAFVEKGSELGLQFVIKGEYGTRPIRQTVLEAHVDYFFPTGENSIAVCCLDLWDESEGE